MRIINVQPCRIKELSGFSYRYSFIMQIGVQFQSTIYNQYSETQLSYLCIEYEKVHKLIYWIFRTT